MVCGGPFYFSEGRLLKDCFARHKPLKWGTDKCLYFPRQFSVPRCNTYQVERQMGNRDEARNTVATASRDRKGVFKWISMRCMSLQLVQIQP